MGRATAVGNGRGGCGCGGDDVATGAGSAGWWCGESAKWSGGCV